MTLLKLSKVILVQVEAFLNLNTLTIKTRQYTYQCVLILVIWETDYFEYVIWETDYLGVGHMGNGLLWGRSYGKRTTLGNGILKFGVGHMGNGLPWETDYFGVGHRGNGLLWGRPYGKRTT